MRKKFPYRTRLDRAQVRQVVAGALREDASRGDVTTRLTVGAAARARAVLRLKSDGVVAGLEVLESVFKEFDRGVRVTARVEDGMWCVRGTEVAVVTGRARSILSCERVALNFVQRMSGIATLTRKFVERVSGTGVKILDTRKTTPTLRLFEKYAVAVGGGFNHRADLAGLVLIKDNHIAAAGGIREAVKLATGRPRRRLVEVEVGPGDSLDRIRDLAVDIVMLDNWPAGRLAAAIRKARRLPCRPWIEVSGNIDLGSVRGVALCGPDFISVGCLTHSAPALDISLDLEM
jgi:nicotinate-nucleotide pyrophosphorylase (carboxylating)